MIDLTQLDKFTLGLAQQTVPGDHIGTVITPDNKLSEGIDSVQRHLPAPFLSLILFCLSNSCLVYSTSFLADI